MAPALRVSTAPRSGWVHVRVNAPLAEKGFPSVVEWIHAADWHEREAEDLFGVRFEGHPHLGDFVLHNDAWQESVEPMRHGFDAEAALPQTCAGCRLAATAHRLRNRGRSSCPLGRNSPASRNQCNFSWKRSARTSSAPPRASITNGERWKNWPRAKRLRRPCCSRNDSRRRRPLHTDWLSSWPIESVGRGRQCRRAHASLRVFLAELERFRQHAAAIQEICESTALVVATSQAGIFEEELLRVSGALTGHRYLFGLLAPGGLLCDLPTEAC